ncbi:MAG: restriction endonuclease, partial [Clostridiales bacterium]|nr:restriction endonuclease [Clostridiales bacterium]
MVGLIQKSGFIKPGKAAGYIEYIATRDGVEKIGADGYLEYMATRPGSHGLFSSRPVVSLDAVLKEAERHTGPVWTLIYSLRREDATRLGYDNAESWHELIKAYQVELATAMKIPPEQFRWYAAYHDADTHPHIHVTVWSDNPKLGFLTPEGIKAMRSVLTNSIFQDELYSLYQQKDISYKELTAQARASMRELVRQMENTICDSPVIGMQMVKLAHDLKNVSGRKVYGYLKKPLKAQVDAIVDELAKVSAVAECYEVWNGLRDELESYYKDTPRQYLPLSQQKEFKAIKNMVIQEAENLRLGVVTFEDERMQDEPPDNSRFSDPDFSDEDKRSVAEELAQDWKYNKSSSIAYRLGRVWRDGLGVLPNDEKAEVWFQRAAEGGHRGAQYALAKLLHEQGRISEAIPWFEQATEGGNPFASYQFGKLYLAGEDVPKDAAKALEYLADAAEQGNSQAQYILGKLYLLGSEVEQDREAAVQWLTLAAAQGHEYAQFFLDHMEQDRDPSVLLCATRLLCRMAQIIRDTPPPAPPTGLVIDRKRFRQLMEKKIAMGHKPDDHEEQGYI